MLKKILIKNYIHSIEVFYVSVLIREGGLDAYSRRYRKKMLVIKNVIHFIIYTDIPTLNRRKKNINKNKYKNQFQSKYYNVHTLKSFI